MRDGFARLAKKVLVKVDGYPRFGWVDIGRFCGF